MTPYYVHGNKWFELYEFELNIRQVEKFDFEKYLLKKTGRTKLKDVPKGLPVIPLEMQPKFKLVNRKPIIASDDELTNNHRAHSAKLRVIERVIL